MPVEVTEPFYSENNIKGGDLNFFHPLLNYAETQNIDPWSQN